MSKTDKWLILIGLCLLLIGGLVYAQVVKAKNDFNNKQPITTRPSGNGDKDVVVYKPMIYLYPEEETEISVKLSDPNKLLFSYPLYGNGWKIKADTNGDLSDTEREYYGLFYEAIGYPAKVTNEGFCLNKDEVISFLEDKLDYLGLNYREKEEMIIYWLPKLTSKAYVYIRFDDFETIDSYMHLDIDPEPNSLIRVMMIFKCLDEPIDVEEQILTKGIREGFTVVEWGGSFVE